MCIRTAVAPFGTLTVRPRATQCGSCFDLGDGLHGNGRQRVGLDDVHVFGERLRRDGCADRRVERIGMTDASSFVAKRTSSMSPPRP